MTTKDYKLFAARLAVKKAHAQSEADRHDCQVIENFLVRVCEEDNPRFHEDQFREACGGT